MPSVQASGSHEPVPAKGLTKIKAIAAGYVHTCVLKKDDSVSCWGSNGKGQLGDGSTASKSTPPA